MEGRYQNGHGWGAFTPALYDARMTETVDPKAQIVGVFDRSAPTYDQTGAAFFTPVATDLVAAIGLRPGQRVLDVGCGRGANLFAAADAVGPTGSVTGTDLAPTMVGETAAEARRRGLTNVEVRVGDAEAPDEPPGSVDAVIAGLVIFFLPDPLAAVRAYRRVLRPGGRLGLSTFSEDREGAMSLVRLRKAALAPFMPAATTAPAEPSTAEPSAPEPSTPEPSTPGPESRLRTRDSLAEVLTAGGFTDVRFDERTYRVRFTDGEHCWRWMWSNGARAALEQIPADRLDAARAAVVSAATELLDDGEGGLALDMDVRLTTATAG
jgi:ubiquinone/menaquinone biosynthesis C-methylase UbiE